MTKDKLDICTMCHIQPDELGGVWTVPNGVDDLNSFYPNSQFVKFAEVLPWA